ncbi:MAG: VWA domain-containing protein [Elusimicrobia bacterium]|nr:VWA domain-containing protein [Elusimicrobiota bacterium]
MKKLVLTVLTLAAFCGGARAQPLDKLAGKLAAGLKDRPAIKLAVLEFPYTGGKASEGPVVVQERLTTALAQNRNITLIERGLLKKVLGELNLQTSGAIDEETVKKLGKMLGADALVTGTLNDLKEDRTEINARVVETGTAKILAASSLSVKKTWKDTVAAVTPPVKPPPQDFGARPLVQVAVLLDTSNSMDGLINQARTQLWKIVNELVSAEKSGSKPSIEVALYEYGNSSLSRESGWLRQVTPFTTDLDLVARELFALKTNGGDEYCGAVIKAAAEGLKWSPKTDVYKTIFIAGNEPFTQGAVSFQEAVLKAKEKNIFVNTIYCGSRQQGLAEQWKAGADLAESDYANIDQTAQNYAIAAPQDDKISQLSAKLNDTYVAYGAGAGGKLAAKQETDSLMQGAGKSVYAERAAFKAAAPSAAAAEASWDVVSAVESGSMKKEDIKADQLPEELKKMDKPALDKYLDGKLAERKKLKDEITRLQGERKVYIAQEEKKSASGTSTLDKAMINTIRRQAASRGYKFAP